MDSDRVDQARGVRIETEILRRGIRLRKSGAERIGPCPRCGGTDRFSINVAENVWNCRRCKPDNISGDVIGLVQWLDDVDFTAACETLYPNGNGAGNGSGELGREVAQYSYEDENGTLLYQVVRFEPKTFRQRAPNGNGLGWIWSTRNVRPLPYRLPELLEAIAHDRTVFVVEGEKDVETLRAHAMPATCNAMGAGKWRSKLNRYFTDADVVVVADHDEPGRAHASTVCAELASIAATVRMFDVGELWPECPDKGDLSDYLQHGGTVAALNAFVESLKPWSPEQVTGTPLVLSMAQLLDTFKPLSYLVEGILLRGYIYALTGQTSHAKTAIALAIAELVTSPHPAMLGKHAVEKGHVLYFIGENPEDIMMRLIGAHTKRDDPNPRDDPCFFIKGCVDVAKEFELIKQQVSARCGKLDLVIIDTSAAYFLGNEELSNTQMGEHARKLRHLSELPGRPCVLVLCHPIKHAITPEQLLPRGGGAFLAEMDGNLTSWKKPDGVIELSYTKLRGPGFEPLNFKMETIRHKTLLCDDKGHELSTVRAVAVTPEMAEQQTKKTEDDEDLILIAYLKHGEEITVRRMAEVCGWEWGNGEPSINRVQLACKRLERYGFLKKNRDSKWRLTNGGLKKARELALRGVRLEHESEADLFDQQRH